LELEYDGKTIYFNLEILPIENGKQKGRFYLVLFSETGDPNRQSESTKKQRSVGRGGQNVEKLKEELAHTKEYLQRTIAEQNAYTEELKSANEEIQSSNEELQSTNEELETAKEELQSINEELTTLNDELQIRNGELLQLNNDLVNVLANITFTVVMVDRELRVRRFNPIAEKTLNLIPTDIGRHIGNLKPNILIDDLTSHLTNVIDSLAIYQAEVQDINGIWYSISIRPYKTTDNTIEGAIMILTNIDALKKAKEKSDSEVR